MDHKKYHYIMVLAFAYGGFSLIFFLSQVYLALWAGQNIDIPNAFERPERHRLMGMAVVTAPHNIILLAGGIISLLAGYAIWSLTRKKEVHAARHGVMTALLLPTEARIIELLKASDDGLAQSKLVAESGYSKVQVHRIVKKLESKGIITKHKYGLTNKLMLAKEYADQPAN